MLTAVLSPLSVRGRTWHVPSEAPTIQAGIDSAASGDTVLVAAGTYGENVDFLGKALTVRGESGAEVTTINGSEGPAAPDSAYAFCLIDVEDPGGTIEGFTITGPLVDPAYIARMGAGIHCSGSTVTARDCVFRENYGAWGGAVYVREGTFFIDTCVLEFNSAVKGAGLYTFGSTGEVSCSVFSHNGQEWGGDGGAIYAMSNYALTLTECVFEENSVHSGGGAVLCESTNPVGIHGCMFLGNSAFDGGAINTYDTRGEIRDCVFLDNAVTHGGGAIRAASSAPRIVSCTFEGNSSEYQGGAIHGYYYCTVGVDSSTIFGNTAPTGGGIFAWFYAHPVVSHTIVAENENGGIWFECGGCEDYFTCNDVWGNTGGDYIGCEPGEGDFSADPLFCDPDNGDFTLDAHSPCLPGQHPDGYDCGRIGAWDQGCGATVAIPTTWGLVKSVFQLPGRR